MSRAVTVAAVDLGAASGRVMTGRVGGGEVRLAGTHRFGNGPVRVGDTLHWDVLGLHREILAGLRAAWADGLDSVGIDSWAVDYGLLDGTGALLGNPVHYRDSRTDGVLAKVLAEIPAAEVYAATGVQFLPFNTLYQLTAAAGSAALAAARSLLLIPDLISLWLTGVAGAEVTNASTTQLLDVHSRQWASGLMARAGIDRGLFADLREPGQPAGELLPHVLAETGLAGPVPVTAVGSHDTASAVAGVPAAGPDFAYISCGTWSLVGVELAAPVLTEQSRLANFSNELGIGGTVRYLRNVMGLWLLQESVRHWASRGLTTALPALLAEASRVPAFTAVVDVDDPDFLPPGDIPARIARACARSGQAPPESPAGVVRCIVDSLALAYRRVVRQAQALSGRSADVVHVVGGGARNTLLCRLTADACGLPVVAGPVEATALGNVLVQAGALGAAPDDLPGMRALVATGQELVRYEPHGSQGAWDAAERRLHEMP